jgi:hypothetical protein
MRQKLFYAFAFVLAGIVVTSGVSAQMPPPLPPSQPPQAAPPVYAPAPAEPPPGWSPGYPPGAATPYRSMPGPMELRYIEGRQVPPGYHPETRIRKGLVISGSILLGVPYFLSLSVAASSKNSADRWLYAPLVGPFADLVARKDTCTTAATSFGTNTSCSNEDTSARFFLMADGLMQVAGSTLLILGLSLPQHVLVRDDAPYVGASDSRVAWSVAPRAFGRSGYGLGLVGTF